MEKNGLEMFSLSAIFMFKKLSLQLILAIIISSLLFSTNPLEDNSGIVSASEGWQGEYTTKVLAMANKERTKKKQPVLVQDSKIQKAAQMKAEDMAKRGYFSHSTPDGKDPWHWLKINGVSYSAAGENLAMNFNNASEVVPAWMDSPKHKENIMNENYLLTGIGVAKGKFKGKDTIFIAEFYSKPIN